MQEKNKFRIIVGIVVIASLLVIILIARNNKNTSTLDSRWLEGQNTVNRYFNPVQSEKVANPDNSIGQSAQPSPTSEIFFVNQGLVCYPPCWDKILHFSEIKSFILGTASKVKTWFSGETGKSN